MPNHPSSLGPGPPYYPEYAALPTNSIYPHPSSPPTSSTAHLPPAHHAPAFAPDPNHFADHAVLSSSTISVGSPSPPPFTSTPPRMPFAAEPHPRACSRLTLADISDVRLADTLALVLAEICSSADHNAPFPDPSDPAALFFSPFKQKSFSLSYYCRRLLQYNCCSKSCLLVSILYLVRLADRYPIFQLNEFNVHRLVCTALMIAAKWLDDYSYSAAHYAKVGGIQSAAEMAKLEEYMLKALDYRLYVSKESFEGVEKHIVQIALSSQ